MTSCDPDTGTCQVAGSGPSRAPIHHPPRRQLTLHYIGDPMCSWCWGIAPAVDEAASWCLTHGIGFEITVGGLRMGGGQPWNDAFKIFLRREWMRIASVTGQPFGYTLLDAADFHYDTEPACRAIVCVQQMVATHTGSGHLQPLATDTLLPLHFMAVVQRKFYFEGRDPKQLDFYADICPSLGLDFTRFSALFTSNEAKQATWQAVERCRRWGVEAFPTLLIERDGHLQTLSQGYTTAERIIEALSAFDHRDESPG
ncbi:MAG: DsbA family protein [Lautropia sp.]|nr:DsbA family protein [Lautropia sp.]